MAEQRKMIQQNLKNKSSDDHHPMSVLSKPNALREPSLNKSAKKQVAKCKTSTFMDDFVNKQDAKKKLEADKGKKKIKYNGGESDESDALSDSEPSDDNLDSSEIMKLIPKRFGRAKYLRGLEEVKKVKKATEEKPKIKKQVITTMPCMSASKKERDNKVIKSESATKKLISINKSVISNIKVHGKHRDVGTQIRYKGDGKDLSLMEIDI